MQHLSEIQLHMQVKKVIHFYLQVHQMMIKYSRSKKKKFKQNYHNFSKSINYSPKMADEKLFIIIFKNINYALSSKCI